MIPLDEARAWVVSSCEPLVPRLVPIDDALGCVAGEPVTATEPIPPFANSSMDGYAVRAADTRSGSARLRVVGAVMAGSSFDGVVGPGEACRIMTGAPLPAGADAVCMLEQATTDDGGRTVTVKPAFGPGDWIRQPGEDVAVGDLVVEAGTVLEPGHIGVLANQGLSEIAVHPRPRVGVLSTGDELMTGPGPLPPGKIRDANRHTLLALVRQQGWQPIDLGIVGDDEAALDQAFDRAAAECDAVLTSGGVSVGDLDVVKVVLERRGGGTMRWLQIAIRPAKPFAFGCLAGSGVPVFGLPGNPVSAMVSFELLARPAIRRRAGHHALVRPVVRAVTETALPRQSDEKIHFVRAQAWLDGDGGWRARALGGQSSHQLRTMADADALIVLPDGDGLAAGDPVELLVLDLDPSRFAAPASVAP